jgi:hypothetical protein
MARFNNVGRFPQQYLNLILLNAAPSFSAPARSGFKTSDQVQGQGAEADRESAAYMRVCEHLSEVCNAAIEPQMGF